MCEECLSGFLVTHQGEVGFPCMKKCGIVRTRALNMFKPNYELLNHIYHNTPDMDANKSRYCLKHYQDKDLYCVECKLPICEDCEPDHTAHGRIRKGILADGESNKGSEDGQV